MSTTPTPAPPAQSAPPAAGASTSGAGAGPESLTPLEQEVLDEYAKLLQNLNELSPLLSSLSTNPTGAVLDGLRMLERKTSLVSTLLKASVYSIVLQQQMLEGGEEGSAEGSGFESGSRGEGSEGL